MSAGVIVLLSKLALLALLILHWRQAKRAADEARAEEDAERARAALRVVDTPPAPERRKEAA